MSTDPLITEAEKSKMRQKNFEESKLDATKHKYGLFSFAGTLAILPNSYERVVKARRNSDGAVITEPRNFMISPLRKGKQSDALFSPTEFISIGDSYRDPPKIYLKDKLRADKMMKSHDVAFKPAGPTDEQTIFEHMSPDRPKIKRRRDSEGNLVFEPRNFYTSPAKKGAPNTTPGTTFGGNFEHIPEPYDRKRELQRKERIESNAKMPDRPFRPTSNFSKPLNKDEDVYNISPDVKRRLRKEKPMKTASHDAPFKPTDSGKKHLVDSLFGTIPEYIAEPIQAVTRKSPSSKIPWKDNTKNISRPTPSISTMMVNIRSEFHI